MSKPPRNPGFLAAVCCALLLGTGTVASAEQPGPARADISSATPEVPLIEGDLRRELIGLFVDEEERNGLLVIAHGEDYLLPLDRILTDIGATLEVRSGAYWFSTPAGDVPAGNALVAASSGALMISVSQLDELLKLQARFDTAEYALFVSRAWSDRSPAYAVTELRTPEFSPPSASIRNIRADYNYFSTEQDSSLWAEYFTAGNLGGGTWQARMEQDPDNDLTPYDYYWRKQGDNNQLLLGNASYSLHPLMETLEQTGAQYLWSNQNFDDVNVGGLRALDDALNYGSGTRHIAGNAEPGAIAELRINGGAIARTRVRLDGTFEFTSVDVPQRGSARIEVLVLDRSGVLLETFDYSQRAGSGQLAAGQHTLFSAAGQQGNPLTDNASDNDGMSGALQWRYGLNERVTLEVGHQYDGDEGSSLAGVSMSLGKHWFTQLAVSDARDREAVEFIVEGGDQRWRVDFRTREYRTDRSGEPERQWIRDGVASYQLAERLEIGLAGRDAYTAFEDTRFVLPSITWGDGRYANFNARPNAGGNYRFDARLTPTHRDAVRYTFEEDRHFVDMRRRARSGLEYYANFRSGEGLSATGELGFISYSERRLWERTQIGLVGSSGDLGYVVQWDARLLPGVYSRLRMTDNAYNNETLGVESGFSVQWALSMDYAFSRGGIVAADDYSGHSESAALAGPVSIDGAALGRDSGVEKLTLIVNGVSHTANVQGGEFFIDGLPPGVHRVSIDPRDLPIQLMPAPDQVYWVELGRSAVTTMPVELQVRYAISGRARSAAGEAMPGLALRVASVDGVLERSLMTDQFGFYRADELPPGHYTVEALRAGEVVARRNVDISDAFLFEQDLMVP